MPELRVERDGPVGLLVIDHPERLNALTLAMWEALPGAVEQLAADPDVRVVLVRGAGEAAFSAGADISEFAEHRSTAAAAASYSARVSHALTALQEARPPTIALVHGVCTGGGAGVALSCDLRFAGDALRFAIPSARLGVVYELEAIARLVRCAGPTAAFDVLASARTVGADEALRLGLVDRVVPEPDLDAETAGYAEQLARNAPLAIEGARIGIRAALDPGNLALVEELERLKTRAIESADYAEGVRAFLEKRPPAFRGL
jgi:enoyl-CoA hydratase/carnithine racemase